MERERISEIVNEINNDEDREEIIAELLASAVNRGLDPTIFASALGHEHPTLQQSVFSLFLRFAKYLTSDMAYIDGRNQAAADLSKKIMELTGDASRLPLI